MNRQDKPSLGSHERGVGRDVGARGFAEGDGPATKLLHDLAYSGLGAVRRLRELAEDLDGPEWQATVERADNLEEMCEKAAAVVAANAMAGRT